MTITPTPERLAWAYARNWLREARQYPRETLVDLALLGFVALMCLGFQLQIVRGAVENYSDALQWFLDKLPNIAALAAVLVPVSNPLSLRNAARGNWTASLPIPDKTHAHWAIRRALFGAALISAACTIILLDVLWLETRVIGIEPATVPLVWLLPGLTVLVTALIRWRKLLQFEENAKRAAKIVQRNAAQIWLSGRFQNPVARGMSFLGLSKFSARKLWLTLSAAALASGGLIFIALRAQQPQLLILGAFAAPLLASSAFEVDTKKLYDLSRTLPLSYGRLLGGQITWSLIFPALFALPFVLAGILGWALRTETGLMLLAVAAALFAQVFRILIALAFPQSRIRQTLFTFSAALVIGVVSVQAPLAAPLLGAILCAAWLVERGHGVWEFGFDSERSR